MAQSLGTYRVWRRQYMGRPAARGWTAGRAAWQNGRQAGGRPEARARMSDTTDPPAAGPQAQQASGVQAVMALYERTGQALYRLAYRITGSREDARDAVQESFVKLMKEEDLSSLHNPQAWLRTVLTHTAIDLRRRRFREAERKREMALDLLAFDAMGSSGKPTAGLSDQEALRRLSHGMELLSGLDRAILLRHAAEDTPVAEIAESVGLSEKAVRNRLSRARIFLRNRMRRAEPET